MKGNRWRVSLLIFALLLCVSFTNADAAKRIYLYDPSVTSDVDINAYLEDGTLQAPNGKSFSQHVEKGPAPASFPTIAVSENSFEHLGASNAEIDGVIFINHANYYVADREAIVLWTIRIPNASSRTPGEFESDLTLSLWIDWNQDTIWRVGECMIRKSLNVQSEFPTAEDEILVYYLTSFFVPDLQEIASMQDLQAEAKYGKAEKDIRYLWARALVAYDDPDVSPDGAQLFGEYEDYRVAYFVQNPYTADGGSR